MFNMLMFVLPMMYSYLMLSCTLHLSLKNKSLQIIEACLVSLITSFISFGLPLLRKCSPCPESDPDSGIECPRPPGMYGNYVNVRSDTCYNYPFGLLLRCCLYLLFYLACNFHF
jgi:hypothetical protein